MYKAISVSLPPSPPSLFHFLYCSSFLGLLLSWSDVRDWRVLRKILHQIESSSPDLFMGVAPVWTEGTEDMASHDVTLIWILSDACNGTKVNTPSLSLSHSNWNNNKYFVFNRPQEHSEVVTPEEKKQWFQLSGQIEILLSEKLENFREHFPFSCPKDDLKISMKLFTLVSYCEIVLNFSSPPLFLPSSFPLSLPLSVSPSLSPRLLKSITVRIQSTLCHSTARTRPSGSSSPSLRGQHSTTTRKYLQNCGSLRNWNWVSFMHDSVVILDLLC